MKGIEILSSHRPDGELLNFFRKIISHYYKEMSSDSQIDRH
jgi:hypothetical protein